jgi:PadR family transcriptional regulator AphA
MSSALRLGSTSYVVLGIVALRGSTTPYDLKRFVERSIGFFWNFPHTQLYAEPERLARAGLLEETREHGGRRRRHYTITDEGRRRLLAWLAEPAPTSTEFRDPGLLKLFFSELAQPEDVAALARAQAADQREVLARYEEIVARFGDRPEYAQRLMSVELGMKYARAGIEFWDDVLERATAAQDRPRARRIASRRSRSAASTSSGA